MRSKRPKHLKNIFKRQLWPGEPHKNLDGQYFPALNDTPCPSICFDIFLEPSAFHSLPESTQNHRNLCSSQHKTLPLGVPVNRKRIKNMRSRHGEPTERGSQGRFLSTVYSRRRGKTHVFEMLFEGLPKAVYLKFFSCLRRIGRIKSLFAWHRSHILR